MRKLLVVSVLALGLGGCAFNPFASVTNPVSKDTLAKLEAGYGVAASIALGYRNACAKKEIPPSCRPIVVQIQNADNYAHGQILVARNFVRNNPTIDATALILTAQNALTAFQKAETDNGVK